MTKEELDRQIALIVTQKFIGKRDGNMIRELAKKLAEKAHEGQFRKWSNPPQPYIVHPIRVADKVASLKGTNDIDVSAAYLHDVLEDCGEQYAPKILELCGEEVLNLVRELTFETEGAEWAGKPRAEKNKVRFAHMRSMSPRSQVIKLVDRWDNLLDMKNAPHKLIHKTVDESYVLLEICGPADPDMAKELETVIKKVEKGRA
jgi:(p)ppGpp synthase/HD superfamily hydrolase